MDPKATLDRLVQACKDKDLDDVFDASTDLLGWINGGGFLPSISAEKLTTILVFLMSVCEDLWDRDDEDAHEEEM